MDVLQSDKLKVNETSDAKNTVKLWWNKVVVVVWEIFAGMLGIYISNVVYTVEK